jgi:hypothetical protein
MQNPLHGQMLFEARKQSEIGAWALKMTNAPEMAIYIKIRAL